ncbi:hypothetical protein ACN93_21195 [Gordonia paraffinivorans]|nr:hypothetical protein ACN93_21195 [Gordonia paraffinivorans]
MITAHNHMPEVDEAVLTAAGAQFDCPLADSSGAAEFGGAGFFSGCGPILEVAVLLQQPPE